MEGNYHTSVLLKESIDLLNVKPDGVYVDCTYGGGGHSRELLSRLNENGKLFAFDQDEDAERNLVQDERLVFVPANFRNIKRFLRLNGVTKVDGILADLGVSSHQFDEGTRGFSYRFDGPLDMRMGGTGKTAADVLNEKSAEELQQLFSEYGEVRNSKTLAQAIVESRAQRSFESIADLKSICAQLSRGDEHRYLAQVFQALRIEVNDELGTLKELLEQSAGLLNIGGRIALLTFHSLEDRLAKNFLKHGSFDDEPMKDLFGRFEVPLKMITKKPVLPSAEEQSRNSRSRSAKLRVGEKQ